MKLNRLGLWSGASIAAIVLVATSEARAQVGSGGNLSGRVTDASTQTPVPDVVVTITSPNLQGEETAVTDANGLWRVQNVPAGNYTVRLDKESFRPFSRSDVALRADVTLRVDAQLLPDSLKEEIVIVATPPTVDVASSNTGLAVTSDFARRVPLVSPGSSTGGASRSFEAAAQAAPQATGDSYGTSINGTTSPENNNVIDGLSRNNAGFGVNGARLSIEFVREVNVLTGGYMPEYGAAGGGIISGTTKTGTNEFHGGAWLYATPGGLEGERRRIFRTGQTITTQPTLNMIGDIGGDIGGPIVKDKLWFYTGFQMSRTSYNLERALNNSKFGEIAETRRNFTASKEEAQAFAKLTWAANSRNRFSVSAYALPSTSGGGNRVPIAPLTGLSAINNVAGTPDSLFNEIKTNSTSLQADWEAQSPSKKVLVKTTVGWMHQYEDTLANDGTRAGDTRGLAGVPAVAWRRNTPGPHGIADFEPVAPWLCDAAGATNASLCPVANYASGGPGFLSSRTFDRFTARSIVTLLGEAAGQHVVKLGAEIEGMSYDSTRAYSGGTSFNESGGGASFNEQRNFTYLTAPDKIVRLNSLRNVTHSLTVGGFAQDSWSILDKVVVNAGLRYDAQILWGGDNAQALVLPNMVSPRLGVVWDPTQSGSAKIYGNYARFYQPAALNFADRAGTGDPQASTRFPATKCNPLDADQLKGACRDQANNANRAELGPSSPDRKYVVTGGGKTAIDPDLKPQYSEELVFGGEYDVIKNGRIGASYTHRWMGPVIEDVSRDEGQTYFITNPGSGATADFPKPTRYYNALTVFFQKQFGNNWEGLASYTLASLQGNYAGLFRPETNQLDPLTNSDYDLKSLTINRKGPLPGDTRHSVKLFGSKTFETSERTSLLVGGAVRGQSGAPTGYTGRHPIYGNDEIFILERGAGTRLPWTFGLDTSFAYTVKLGPTQALTASLDIFNLLNFQEILTRDQRYTNSEVAPIPGGRVKDLGKLTSSTGGSFTQAEVNPNFSNPLTFQQPRQIRFGLRGTF